MQTERYQAELANKISNGRAVGNLYVVTQRPLGMSGILFIFRTRAEQARFIDMQTATGYEI